MDYNELLGVENFQNLPQSTVLELLQSFIERKVLHALKGMYPMKAPSPDDFHALFLPMLLVHCGVRSVESGIGLFE